MVLLLKLIILFTLKRTKSKGVIFFNFITKYLLAALSYGRSDLV
uniref:Uncharacterized protein n=1 Tax=Microplitis mediator bracovirus TaxID=1836595 RepID=A0A2I6SGW6_9VIRU|nr:hypothetical protein MmBV_CPP2 [Microplitis mediator bracovirus]